MGTLSVPVVHHPLDQSLDIKIVYEGEQREAGRRRLFREALAVMLLRFNDYSLNDEQ